MASLERRREERALIDSGRHSHKGERRPDGTPPEQYALAPQDAVWGGEGSTLLNCAGPSVTENGATARGVRGIPISHAMARPAPLKARRRRMSESRRKWLFRKTLPEGRLMIRCTTYLTLAACVMAVPGAV